MMQHIILQKKIFVGLGVIALLNLSLPTGISEASRTSDTLRSFIGYALQNTASKMKADREKEKQARLIEEANERAWIQQHDITYTSYREKSGDMDGYYIPASACVQESSLYGQYPFIGTGRGNIFYIDPATCSYQVNDDGTTTLACLLYAGSGGADANGFPAKIAPLYVQYSTYIDDGVTHVILEYLIYPREDVVNQRLDFENGTEVTDTMLSYDNGFLEFVYEQVAAYSHV
ncbi:hypothetical protein [Mitsuokella multacida]|uniref:hypothetical protein n=1 Tax=Mitsuokella multacida TaxID=52226 RepID=UPI00242B2B9E|nr:hypothetical protein [Mitsuokella multacida]